MNISLFRILLILLFSTVLGACSLSPKIVQPERRFFWPPEPEQPRIEWIATYHGDLDIKQKNLMSAIVGDDSSVNLARPVSVAGDGDGRLVVSDQQLGQVFMFDLNRHDASPFGGSTNATSFTQPSGVAVDGGGDFYVADNGARKIFVVNSSNVLLRVMDISSHVKSIGNIAIDRKRATLVVPDAKGGKLVLFSLKGELLSTIEGKGYFSYPNAVAVASDGSFFIADTFNATIVHFSGAGKFLKAIGKRGDSVGNLTLVTGVAVDSEDHVYASDGRLHNITVFSKEGETLLVVGGLHSTATKNIGRGGFLVPQGVSIDKNDRIYIADSLNQRVQVLQYLNQRYLSEHPIVKPLP